MLSIPEINLLKSQNEGLKQQNKDLQKDNNNLVRKLNELKSQCKAEKLRNKNLMTMYYKLKDTCLNTGKRFAISKVEQKD